MRVACAVRAVRKVAKEPLVGGPELEDEEPGLPGLPELLGDEEDEGEDGLVEVEDEGPKGFVEEEDVAFVRSNWMLPFSSCMLMSADCESEETEEPDELA